MKCVSTVVYKNKVNDSYTQRIFPQRGLRQDETLSPYLFIMCAEGLSAMLQKAEYEGKIERIKICQVCYHAKRLRTIMQTRIRKIKGVCWSGALASELEANFLQS